MTPYPANYPQIFDGFCYSGLFGVRPLTGISWYWSCLANIENLRLVADSYRTRWWVVPKNFDGPTGATANIQPGKTIFYEFQVKPGSYLWGLQFAVYNDSVEQTQFSVLARQGSDLGLSDRPLVASGVYSNSPVDAFNTLYPPVNLLPEPRLIFSPAQLHCEISNDTDPADAGEESTAVSVQLLLLFAEPR